MSLRSMVGLIVSCVAVVAVAVFRGDTAVGGTQTTVTDAAGAIIAPFPGLVSAVSGSDAQRALREPELAPGGPSPCLPR